MKPYNRHLLIEPEEEEEEQSESVIVLPTDYEKPKSQYLVAKVLDFSKDCTAIHHGGDIIVVERRMLHTVDIKGETYYLVLENYIFGRLENHEA